MDISVFLEPLDPERFGNYGDQKTTFGNVITKNINAEKFPDTEGYHIAIIGEIGRAHV